MKRMFFSLFIFLIPITLLSYDILPVDSIKVGMKGYGISVFKNNEPDTFGVEILGILDKIAPGRRLIIARASGCGLEKTGIISGMSGSPIFINGKIIGAAAYAWSFSIEPITGITPIEEIIATKRDSIEGGESGSDIKIPGEGKMSPYSGITLTRIQTPLSISGVDEYLIGEIDKFFGKKGFNVVLGGSQSGVKQEKDSLFVGSAVAAKLVGGDASMSAIGTVTYVDGKDVFAFGHPLYFSGTTSIPMATAYVHTIMPSQYSSFKIASVGKEVGAVLQDRGTAIYGLIGEKAKTIPLSITVTQKRNCKTFHFDVIEHKELTPFLTGTTLLNAILSNARGYGALSLSLGINLKLAKYGDVKLKNFFSGESALTLSLNSISQMLHSILNDVYEEIEINEVEITVDVTEEIKTALIETVKPGSFTVKRGEETDLVVFLKELRGKNLKERFTVRIPETYTDSIVKIAVVGAEGYKNLESERRAGMFITEKPGDVIKLLKLSPRNNVLYCLVLSTKPGMIIKGYEFGSLPSSMLHLMKGSQNLGEGRFTRGDIITRIERECNFAVFGASVVILKVID